MIDRYKPLVHEVNATVRMGAHPEGEYGRAADYDALAAETTAYVDKLVAEKRELEAALREAASTLQDLAASCRAFEHHRAASAAEACEQHVRAALVIPKPGFAVERGEIKYNRTGTTSCDYSIATDDPTKFKSEHKRIAALSAERDTLENSRAKAHALLIEWFWPPEDDEEGKAIRVIVGLLARPTTPSLETEGVK